MSDVLSAVGEATGLKPSDQVIALGLISAAKAKAMAYCQAYLTTASADLRHILNTHLQDAFAEAERYMLLLEKKEWYPVHATLDEHVQLSLDFAYPAVQ